MFHVVPEISVPNTEFILSYAHAVLYNGSYGLKIILELSFIHRSNNIVL